MRLIKPTPIAAWQPYVFFEKEFSPGECETIIHIAKGLPAAAALTGGDDAGQENKIIRSSELHWAPETEQTNWIYDRLENVCLKVMQNWYPFRLSGFTEYIQLTRYFSSEGGHYDWHQDFGPGNMSSRKLSLVMILSKPEDFEGGQLEVMAIPGPDKVVKQATQGTVIAFPSWELHRVSEVTRGERWSLVSWVHGPPFS